MPCCSSPQPCLAAAVLQNNLPCHDMLPQLCLVVTVLQNCPPCHSLLQQLCLAVTMLRERRTMLQPAAILPCCSCTTNKPAMSQPAATTMPCCDSAAKTTRHAAARRNDALLQQCCKNQSRAKHASSSRCLLPFPTKMHEHLVTTIASVNYDTCQLYNTGSHQQRSS